MSWVVTAVVGGSVLDGANQRGAAKDAAGAQLEGTRLGIEETRRQFNSMKELLSPYISAGGSAFTEQQALIGLGGEEAEQSAISRIEQSPEFRAITEAGEEGILQNASATGGLRGGNVQKTLSEFRPNVLSSLIENRYNKYAGITAQGQNAAASLGGAGQTAGVNISNLYGQGAAAQAGGILAEGQANSNMWGNITQGIGAAVGAFSPSASPIAKSF